MKYIYYPGCSLKETGRAYEESFLTTFNSLNIELEELDDWNCCGATAYMSVDELQAFMLAARNLALAEQYNGSDKREVHIVAPCSACYLVLTKTQHYIDEYSEIGEKIHSALQECNLKYEGRVKVRHPLEILCNDVGLDKIKKNVVKPFEDLKVACYYGCQIVRPYSIFDDAYSPSFMEKLMKILGAHPIEWPLKTRCCGGTLTGTIEEVGLRLSYILLKEAQKRGANIVSTACPLCQFNLECYQNQMNREFEDQIDIPVAFFTQIMGLAFGISEHELGIHRLFNPLKPVMSK